MYPVMLDIAGRSCLLVGGGSVALTKAEGLLVAGARVTVVAPHAVPALLELGLRGRLVFEQRPFREDDIAGHALIFAATNDEAVNRRVAQAAAQAGTWVNVADDALLSSFHLPARLRRGALQIAIATSGKAPFVARRLRGLLQRLFGPEWADWLEAASEFRRTVRALPLSEAERTWRYDAFFAATVGASHLAVRLPGDAELRDLASGRAPS